MTVTNINPMNFVNPVNAAARTNSPTTPTASQGVLSNTQNALQTSGAAVLHFFNFDGDSAVISQRALQLACGIILD